MADSTDGITSGAGAANPTGFAEIEIGGRAYRLRLGFRQVAEADAYCRKEYGVPFSQALSGGALDLNLLAVAFYFGARRFNRGLDSFGAALHVLDGLTDVGALGDAIGEALAAGGLIKAEAAGDATAPLGDEGEA